MTPNLWVLRDESGKILDSSDKPDDLRDYAAIHGYPCDLYELDVQPGEVVRDTRVERFHYPLIEPESCWQCTEYKHRIMVVERVVDGVVTYKDCYTGMDKYHVLRGVSSLLQWEVDVAAGRLRRL